MTLKVDNPKPNNVDVTVTITIKQKSTDKGQELDRVILSRDDYQVPFVPPANKVFNEFKIKVPREALHRGPNRFKLVAYNQALGPHEATATVDFTTDPANPTKYPLRPVRGHQRLQQGCGVREGQTRWPEPQSACQ